MYPRPEPGHSLHQQEAARVLCAGCGGVRLGQAQSRAALDARRARSHRLRHGDRHLGGDAGEDRGPHRADREWACGGLLRDRRHRHRHLHDHGAACRRHVGRSHRECDGEARRLDAAAVAGRRRLMDGGLSGRRDRSGGRSIPCAIFEGRVDWQMRGAGRPSGKARRGWQAATGFAASRARHRAPLPDRTTRTVSTRTTTSRKSEWFFT